MASHEQAFQLWLRDVDHILVGAVGVGYRDLPDFPSRDLYDEGASEVEAARDALERADYPRDLIEGVLPL